MGAGDRPILRPKCGRIKNLTIFWEYRVKMISNPVSHFPVLPLSSEIFARLNSFREIVVGAGNWLILRPKCGRGQKSTIFWKTSTKSLSNALSHVTQLFLSSEIFAGGESISIFRLLSATYTTPLTGFFCLTSFVISLWFESIVRILFSTNIILWRR